jgi:hypothetical protein
MKGVIRYISHNFVLTAFLCLGGLFSIAPAQNWQSLPMHLDYTPYNLYSDSTNDVLYILGLFQHIDGFPVPGIVAFDGSTWDSVGSNSEAQSFGCMERINGKLYAGGETFSAWDGHQWENTHTDGRIWSIGSYDGQLLVGGFFEVIGGDSLATIAAFDGQTWHDAFGSQALFKGKQNLVSAISVFKDELYLAGSIDYLGPMKEIMKWDGSTWSDVGGGIGGGGMACINDMEVYQGELYVGGYFSETEGCPGNNIARWDGTRWSNVGEGLGLGQVLELYTFEGKLYASGQFYTAGGVPASFIAYWDGASWCSFGGTIDNAISGMAAYHGELFIAGGFWTLDGDSIRGIAKWVGGNYVDTCVYVPVGVPAIDSGSFVGLFPNPTHSEFRLTLPHRVGSCTVRIRDVTGRQVGLTVVVHEGDGQVNVEWLPSGVYFVEVGMRGKVEVIKLVKE